MAFGNYNNANKNSTQDNRRNTNTYTAMSFSNDSSTIHPSRFSISYLNRTMRISIADKNQVSNTDFATYDNANAASIYLSCTKARILCELIRDLLNDTSGNINNVAVETRIGIIKVSNGKEFGSNSYCIDVMTIGNDGSLIDHIYECSSEYNGAYNYFTDDPDSMKNVSYPSLEIEMFVTALEEYHKASGYAIAASVHESGAYYRYTMNELLNAIGEKVGVVTNNNKTNYSSKSFFSNNNAAEASTNTSVTTVNTPMEYTTGSFEDIASNY